MPLLFVRQDITKMQVDAIVNAANETLLGGGGVDGAIHRAAGRGLVRECSKLGGCRTGEAKRTKGYRLPCKYVIHTVGPVWHGGTADEESLLSACYANALRIADESACESVAFPLISAGVYGYPKEQAIRVAVHAIRTFLQTHEMTVYLVLFDRDSVNAARERFIELQQFIDDHAVQEIEMQFSRRRNMPFSSAAAKDKHGKKRKSKSEPEYSTEADVSYDISDAMPFTSDNFSLPEAEEEPAPYPTAPAPQAAAALTPLDDLLLQLDESFSEMLLRKIDEKNMTDAECYKKANIDRKLFSKIRSNPQYKPSKSTALAFAIALELPLAEVREMLGKAGYALSRSSKSDVIVEYFIAKGNYDVFDINQALFAFDQNLLGA